MQDITKVICESKNYGRMLCSNKCGTSKGSTFINVSAFTRTRSNILWAPQSTLDDLIS